MTSGPATPFGGQGDELYEALIDAHAGLDPEQSLALHARLVLLLAGEIGDSERVLTLIARARDSLGAPENGSREP
ncbi:DUF2783 domain-containing protein [Enterovirga sp. CN4-39]|uniref:DUF2783 domain-containing protein n=1 Tax=Enterovirga sp. CN4-39 TaxID=3400910 RepID=UPI003BFB0A73